MEQRNMILAFALSMAVLLAWQFLFPQPEPKPAAVKTAPAKQQTKQQKAPAEVAASRRQESVKAPPTVENLAPPAKPTSSGHKVLAEIRNNLLDLKISAKGAMIEADAVRYRQSIRPDSPPVRILEFGPRHSRYVNAGLFGEPTPVFTVVSNTRKDGAVVLELEARLASGGRWQRRLSLSDDSYVIDIEDRVSGSVARRMYYQVVEREPDRKKSRIYQYRGPVALLDGKLKEISFEDLDKKSPVLFTAKGGWTGIMNRYFIAAVIGEKDQTYRYYFKADGTAYQTGLIENSRDEGRETRFGIRVYVGPKSIPAMKTLGVGLERAVDFGWFAFIAKPLHALLLGFYKYIHNFGLCIILLVIVIKILFLWPTKKSYESMAAMRKLQPEMQRLKELYGDDRQKMGQEMMELYKKHKVNPMGGCLPIVIQIPVFFALYKVLLMSIEMRHAPFFGWIRDLSAMDPYYVLPVLMGATMLLQQRLNPTPPDPMQARIMKFLPVIFTFMFLFFPSGLVLYWLVNNILSIAQQWYVMKKVQAA